MDESTVRRYVGWRKRELGLLKREIFRKCVAALESIRRTHSLEQFLADELIRAAAERNIQVAIQSVLDICNHVVADMKLEVPDEDKHAFQILASHSLA